jgi:hypothetical protein
MMPLSQVLAYNTEHLIDAAAHWQALADQREEVFATVHNEARIMPWEGLTADALHARTGADYNTAMQSAENLRSAAMIAKDGASTLDQMRSRVMYTIEDGQADGFSPTEALVFVDTRPSANPAVAAQRQQQAQVYTGQLQSQVSDLVAHDTKVGADMSNATAGEGKIMFTDYTTGDGKKIPSPPPQPPTVINASPAPPDPHHTSITGAPVCAGDQIIGRLLEILAGGAGVGLSIPAEAPSLGTSTAGLLASGSLLWNGIDGLENCP